MTNLLQKLTLDDIPTLEGKRVIVRVDYNVPIKDKKIQDNNRIKETIPTIEKIFSKGAKNIVLMSHLGRPDGKPNEKYSLELVSKELSILLKKPVKFSKDCVGEQTKKDVSELKEGEIILLENLRFHVEEEGKGLNEKGEKVKANKEDIQRFCSYLTSYGDVYINDAFGTAHRAHGSMVGVNLEIRAAGLLLKKELEYFGKVLSNPKKPFLAILGGAKVVDKIQLIFNLLDKVDEMIICGGMAFTFLKINNNARIGKSLFDVEGSKSVKEIIEKAKQKGVKIHFPLDFVIAEKISDDVEVKITTLEEGVDDHLMSLDIGPKSREYFKEVCKNAKTIIWNGPAGAFEYKKFRNGSIAILEGVVEATKLGATTIVGGGDSASFVAGQNASEKVSHVSTGGGASLELLEGKELPGVTFLSNKK
jgi:phosphoglycerate kinase